MKAAELRPGQRIRVGKAEWKVSKLNEYGVVFIEDERPLFTKTLDAIGFTVVPDPAPDGTVWRDDRELRVEYAVVAVVDGNCYWVGSPDACIKVPTPTDLTAPDSGWTQVGGAR